MSIKRITPVLFAERIEPSLELWERRLGFKRVAEVPEGDRLGFAMLQGDGVELMYQSYESVAHDIAPLEDEVRNSRQFLFIEVDDLAAIEAKVKGVPEVVPKRETFYGMTEVIVRDPAGHVIVFAQPKAKA
jgi:uncharacterized glyoxalase superfamily protein PhnB